MNVRRRDLIHFGLGVVITPAILAISSKVLEPQVEITFPREGDFVDGYAACHFQASFLPEGYKFYGAVRDLPGGIFPNGNPAEAIAHADINILHLGEGWRIDLRVGDESHPGNYELLVLLANSKGVAEINAYQQDGELHNNWQPVNLSKNVQVMTAVSVERR